MNSSGESREGCGNGWIGPLRREKVKMSARNTSKICSNPEHQRRIANIADQRALFAVKVFVPIDLDVTGVAK